MTQENYVTKNSYTRAEADLLIAISEWVSAIGQLPESKALALDDLAAIQAKQVLQQPSITWSVVFPHSHAVRVLVCIEIFGRCLPWFEQTLTTSPRD